MSDEFSSFYGHDEQPERWCSTCEHHAEDCTCNPDGDETVEECQAARAAEQIEAWQEASERQGAE